MSLRNQTAFLLIGLSIAFVIITYAVQVAVVMPAFAELELQGGERDVDRCVDAIRNELEGLSNTANDWASWNDSYQYVEDQNETFSKANLIDESFSNTHLNLICILDLNRRIVWGQAHDMVTLEAIEVRISSRFFRKTKVRSQRMRTLKMHGRDSADQSGFTPAGVSANGQHETRRTDSRFSCDGTVSQPA